MKMASNENVYTTKHGMWSLEYVMVVDIRSWETNTCTYCSFADNNEGVITKKKEGKVEKHEDEEDWNTGEKENTSKRRTFLLKESM